MINLIPPEARTRITTEYRLRVISAWLFMAAVSAATVGALLFPAYVLVTSQVRVYEVSARDASVRVAENTNSEKSLVLASVQARMIMENAQHQDMVGVYDIIEAMVDRPAITATSYTFNRTGTTISGVRVEGEAATRLALATFRDRLTGHPLIEKVDLPISNLAKDRDITFSLLLTLATSTNSTP